ncbi:ATP-grasp domain-containing protein [Haliangium sp.]|uniref:ATP-grasp domain-containing protein n=1 Tax=Haliangium sp. TaxID=2663208 RepID=UPI003D127A68
MSTVGGGAGVGGEGEAPAVLLLSSKRAYPTEDFVAAAERLGVACVLATDRCHVLAGLWPEGALALDLSDPDGAAEALAAVHARRPLAGIVATDERTAVIAARAAERLGLAGNDVEAARCAADKHRLRRRLSAAGRVQPRFAVVPARAAAPELDAALVGLDFPVVLKPLHLSASRGVMRADDRIQLDRRHARLAALLDDPEVAALTPADPERGPASAQVLIESFVPGPELAFEGLLQGGRLRPLALFDKPDPLDGPFFAETMYVTPSRQSPAVQEAVVAEVAAAARAIGLREGPVHAELRLAPSAWAGTARARPVVAAGPDPDPLVPVLLEIAARAIGGLCHRSLRFGAGVSLEALLIAHAAGLDPDLLGPREAAASGVYMLPVPRPGVLRAVRGVDAARAVPGVRDVVITVRPGEVMVPLPEGHSYLGFAFAAGDSPEVVTAALRRAVACVEFDIATRVPARP